MKTGTVITSGSHFHAYIDPVLSCGPDQFLKSSGASNPSVEKEKIPLAQKTDSTFSLIAAIYPNPNDGKFNLQLENFVAGETATITIYNSLGVIVYENATANLRSSIDISTQASGLYFIKVQSGGKVYAGKVVKQ